MCSFLRFNVAEIAAMSQDLPYQAKNLVKRMMSDSKVDIQNHWKLITILIGANDFCSNVCYFENPSQILLDHEQNLIRALRILRDHLPRTMVNVASTPSAYTVNNVSSNCKVMRHISLQMSVN